MLIPLGILAGAGGAVSSYEHIATTTLTSPQATVTFSNLNDYSGTYKHLQIRASVRKSTAGDTDFDIIMNNDSAYNYSQHELRGYSGSVQAGSFASMNKIFLTNLVIGSGETTGHFGVAIIDIYDVYANKFKTIKSISGHVSNANPIINLTSGHYRSLSTLSSISFPANGAWQFVAGSRFSIYGIKGA